jgi:hypothetical protein
MTDVVRDATDPAINADIDQAIEASIQYFARRPREELDGRIAELQDEWDIERWLETNAAALSLAGLTLGILGRRVWLGLPVIVSSFLLQHALKGWCPPVPLFRRMGARTRQEIDRELYALKVLRGDFAHLIRRAEANDAAPGVAAPVDAASTALGAVPT